MVGLLLLCVAACIEPYAPPGVVKSGELITIEGIVDLTDKVATVKITSPVVLNSDEAPEKETGATVSIHADNGKTYALPEIEPGFYKLEQIDIAPGSTCRLVVNTKGGGQYESTEVKLKQTPKIDSVYFDFTNDGVSVLVDTRDPAANSIYYQWLYEETWEYTAPFESSFKLVYIDQIGRYSAVHRPASERIYRCYKTVPSSRITIASTKSLAADVVSRKQIVFIPVADQKVSVRYSIKVKQRAISEEEYQYLSQLQTTTENVGGLFDRQPSQVYGNIKRVSEKGGEAIGFFGGGTHDEQRVFLGFYELPPQLLVPQRRGSCVLDTVCALPARFSAIKCSVDMENISPSTLIVAEVPQTGLTPTGFTTATDECADCRSQGGVLTRPDFW